MKYRDPYTTMAGQALESYLKTGRAEASEDLTNLDIFKKKGSCFVTIYKNGELRGCMGTIKPVRENLRQEIMENTVRAAVMDARFLPILEEELPSLDFSVDIIREPEIIYTAEGYNVKEYGIIVMKDDRTGLLLPDLDGVHTPSEQLRIALGKAGIGPDERFVMQRFRTEHYGQKNQ